MIKKIKGWFKSLVGDLLASKKFRIGVVSILASVIMAIAGDKFGIPEDKAVMLAERIFLGGMTMVGAQGVADWGKEKAKIEYIGDE